MKMNKYTLLAAAVSTALFSGATLAETEIALDVISGDEAAPKVEKVNGTDVISDGFLLCQLMSNNPKLN